MSAAKIPIPDVIQSEVVYSGYFDMQIDQLQLPHGPKRPYTILNVKAHAAAIVAKTPDGKFIINKEYRHPTGKWLLSCPGGRMDPGESPVEAARRELLEETGYAGDNPILLGAAFPFAGVTDQLIHYILIQNAVYKQPPALEPFELIHTELKTEEELKREIASGAPIDGVLCTALWLASMH